MTPDTLHDQIAKKCIHFNGILNKTCKAGVCYECIRDLPCFRKSAAVDVKPTSCASCEWPTEEYITSFMAVILESEAKAAKAADLCEKIRVEHKGHDWEGVEVCPVCKGKLHISHAGYNGHLMVKCETENCLAWME